MAKKKKKKSGKLPYVHIDVIPEEEAQPEAPVPSQQGASQAPAAAQQRSAAQGASRGQKGFAKQPNYNQYPSEVISASESGYAKRSVDGADDDEPEQIAPFVIPVFRKSDIPQQPQGAPAQAFYGTGQFPPIGQSANPRQNLAQIQNNLLSQHNMAQQQASQQAAARQAAQQQAMAKAHSQQQTAQQRQQPAAQNAARGQQQAARQGNPRQGVQAAQQAAARSQQAASAAAQRQQHANMQPAQAQQRAGAAAGAGVSSAQQHPSGAQDARMQSQHPGATGPIQVQAAVQQNQHAQAQHHLQPHQTGQFPRVDASMAQTQQARAGAGAASGMTTSPAATGSMQAVAAAAAARAEQTRMQASFGGMQAGMAANRMQAAQGQGPRQNMQQAAAVQASQAHQAAAAQASRRMQASQTHQPMQPAASQTPSQSTSSRQAVPAQATRQPSASVTSAASAPAPQQASAETKPVQAAAGGNVGDPLLDAKAIEESPMFDKPPVSIAEGMRKSDSGRKTRRRVVIAIVAVLVLACAGVAAYFMLSQQGVVPQITIETKTVPVTPQGSSESSSAATGSSAASSASSAASEGTGSGDLSGTVVYQYSANTASGVEYKVEETVSFQSNGDCQSSTMNMTFPDEASAKTFTDNLARDYGTSFKLDSLNGVNAVVTIDNSGLHLSRDEYENALRYSVTDLVVVGK